MESQRPHSLARHLAAPAALLAACGGDPDAIDVDAGAPDAGGAIADAAAPDAAAPDASGQGAEPSYALNGDLQVAAERGGDGGDRFQLVCPTGQIAVGLQGSSGRLVDSVRALCRVLAADGSLGDEVHETPEAGEANDNPFELACPEGEAIVAVRGRAGGDIDAIGIECAPVVPWVDEGRERAAVGELRGGDGGRAFLDLCSRGFFAAEIAGRHSDVIHNLQIRCDRVIDESDTRISGPFSRGSETDELPPRGGSDTRTGSLECGDGELPIGLLGSSSDRVNSLQLACGALAADGSLEEAGPSEPVGSTQDGEAFAEYCPADEAIVGLRGRAGDEIDAIGLVCAPVAGRLEDGTGVHPWGRLRGGTGGDAFSDVCADAMFVRDISALSGGGVVRAMTGRCVEVTGPETSRR